MNTNTGNGLDGIPHLKQSITDILTTPIGSRIMRRNYGSRLFELLDNPTTEGFAIELYAATAEALGRWEHRFALKQVAIESIVKGNVTLTLEGIYLPEGKEVRLEGIII